MNPNLVFHIGCHKTGSSSIQASLVGLSNQDWSFISSRSTGNESGGMVTAFAQAPWKERGHVLRGHSRSQVLEKSKQHRRWLTQQIKNSPSRQKLISAESICSFSLDELTHVRDFTHALGHLPKVIAYLRPLCAWMESSFQQRLKARTFDTLRCSSLLDALKLPGYVDMLHRLHHVFGPEHVRLLAFEPSRFPGNDVVLDFCLRLGIHADSVCFRRVNERMSLLSAKILCLASDPSAESTLLPDFWRNGSAAYGRSRTLKIILSDFDDQPKLKIKKSIL
jgi:hypothetical protein